MTTVELWTIGIAAYAAIVSTFVLGWDAYKWLASGAKIDMSASLNMKIIGSIEPDDKTYVSVRQKMGTDLFMAAISRNRIAT